MSAFRLALVSFFVAGCSPPPPAPQHATPTPTPTPAPGPTPATPAVVSAPSADDSFQTLSTRFLDGYLEHSPVDATGAGEHRYDAKWPDVSPAGDAQLRTFYEDQRAALSRIARDKLGVQNAIDAQIIEDRIALGLESLDVFKPRDVEPTYYTGLIGEGLDPLVNRNFGTPESRLASLRGRLDGIPAVVAAAKQRLTRPAKINTETAIKQNKGLIGLVDSELATRFGKQPELAASAKRAATALREFQTFLEKDLLPRSDGSFRIGREMFAKKLSLVLQDQVDIDALAASARELLTQTQHEMVETAKLIWTEDKRGPLPKLDTPAQQKAFVKQVLDYVAQDRPTNQTILADANGLLAKATKFVGDNDLVRLPSEPVKVIEMPEYRRGVAVAYCDSSGPLETTPETFFAIAPTPSDWPKKRVESFYREYNRAMLADLVVHEAMPGHYLQGMHNNKFPSKLRAVLWSGPFVEGWAVYTEWLMAEKGFGGPRVKLERQKMVLRLAANAILDHDIHAGTMEEKDALALMEGEAFQEEGEAVGKWARARLTSAQLTTYFYGFSEFVKLRKAAEAKPGFSERAYHDRLLSWGSPAMRFVRELAAAH